MSSSSQPKFEESDELETAVDQAISACGGNMRATIGALIVANEYLESEVAELMKARAEIERRLARAEQSWLEASEAVERAAHAVAK